MAKVILNDIVSGFDSTAAFNENYDLIEAGFENTLSRDGTSPNQMEADIDLNSNDLLNVNRINTAQLYLNGGLVTVSELVVSGLGVEEHTATSGQTVFVLSTITYTTGINGIQVFINGVLQSLTTYSETDTNTITFTTGLNLGDFVSFNVFNFA